MLKFGFQKKSLSLITGIGLCGLLLFSKAASAQVQVSPLVIFTETKQGKAIGVINLSNQGNEEARMTLYALPFTYGPNGFQLLESSPNDLSPYLIFSPREVIMQPRQTRRVRLLAQLLPSLTQGEYRAVIFVEPVKEKPTTGLGLSSRIGVVVYVRNGKSIESLTAKEVNYNGEIKELILVVKNEGNVTIRPRITWRLSKEGKEVYRGEVSETTVIAEGTRNVAISIKEGTITKLIPAGNYQLTGELLWGDIFNLKTVHFSWPVTIP